MRKPFHFLLLVTSLTICINCAQEPNLEELREQVFETEKAFAKTMADRDFEAFKSFLSEEAVFLSGNIRQRGKSQVAERWQKYFDETEAPFSWRPETVEVLDSGKLALSTGPVYNTDGKLISFYTSIWKLESPDAWRIVFDKGNKVCQDAAP